MLCAPLISHQVMGLHRKIMTKPKETIPEDRHIPLSEALEEIFSELMDEPFDSLKVEQTRHLEEALNALHETFS